MVKVSEQLAAEFREVYKEVDQWESWQRSLDPLGSEYDDQNCKGGSDTQVDRKK